MAADTSKSRKTRTVIRFAERVVEAFTLVSIILFVSFFTWAAFFGSGVDPIANFSRKVGYGIEVSLRTLSPLVKPIVDCFGG